MKNIFVIMMLAATLAMVDTTHAGIFTDYDSCLDDIRKELKKTGTFYRFDLKVTKHVKFHEHKEMIHYSIIGVTSYGDEVSINKKMVCWTDAEAYEAEQARIASEKAEAERKAASIAEQERIKANKARKAKLAANKRASDKRIADAKHAAKLKRELEVQAVELAKKEAIEMAKLKAEQEELAAIKAVLFDNVRGQADQCVKSALDEHDLADHKNSKYSKVKITVTIPSEPVNGSTITINLTKFRYYRGVTGTMLQKSKKKFSTTCTVLL